MLYLQFFYPTSLIQYCIYSAVHFLYSLALQGIPFQRGKIHVLLFPLENFCVKFNANFIFSFIFYFKFNLLSCLIHFFLNLFFRQEHKDLRILKTWIFYLPLIQEFSCFVVVYRFWNFVLNLLLLNLG